MLDKLLLNQSTKSNGAMLVRLLVLGGLSSLAASIASSSAYSQQNLPGQLEARKYIGMINNAQKDYFEGNHYFALKLGQLNIGIPSKTFYYTYVIAPTKGSNYKEQVVTHQARPLPNRSYVKAVIGGVLGVSTTNGGLASAYSITCVANLSPAQGGPNGNQLINTGVPLAVPIGCPKGYRQI